VCEILCEVLVVEAVEDGAVVPCACGPLRQQLCRCHTPQGVLKMLMGVGAAEGVEVAKVEESAQIC